MKITMSSAPETEFNLNSLTQSSRKGKKMVEIVPNSERFTDLGQILAMVEGRIPCGDATTNLIRILRQTVAAGYRIVSPNPEPKHLFLIRVLRDSHKYYVVADSVDRAWEKVRSLMKSRLHADSVSEPVFVSAERVASEREQWLEEELIR